MRPTVSNFNTFRSARPTSPPQTPLATSPPSNSKNNAKSGGFSPQTPHHHNRRHPNSQPMSSHQSNIRPLGNGPNFSFTRSAHQHGGLSPLSSSSSSAPSDSSSSDSGSVSSEQPEPLPAPSPPATRTRIVTHATFTVEELSDFDDSDDDRLGVVRPHAIEDAESDRSRSRSRNPPEIDRTVMYKFQKLDCDDSSDETDVDADEFSAFLLKRRLERRQKRMSSGSIGKRTISESIGSDTDREDLKLFVGSSARRLRRKVGERRSLQFSDPPLPRIDQMDEPPTSEDDFLDEDALKELPYYTLDYITMEIDSP